MSVLPKHWLIAFLVLWLPLQAIAAQMVVCPEGSPDMEIPATDAALPEHDCCDKADPCQPMDCDQCSKCGVAAGTGAIASAFPNRFPPLKQTMTTGHVDIVTSPYRDVLFKPPRRS